MLMISKLDFGLAAPSPDTRGLFQNCKLRKEIHFSHTCGQNRSSLHGSQRKVTLYPKCVLSAL